MNPLISLLLSSTDTDEQFANYLSTRQNPIARGAGSLLNGFLSLDRRITEGAQNALGSIVNRVFGGSREGAPLPGWLEGNTLGPPRELGFAPYEGYRPPDFSRLTPQQEENTLYGQGQGMMRGPAAPPGQRSGVGVRGGQTIASGRAAQAMFGGMREANNQQMLDDAQRAYQARAQTIMR